VSQAYDPAARGGTTTIVVSRRGVVRRNWVSSNGTQMNCSGGPMPWGTWVTCEETVNGPDVGPDFTGVSNAPLKEKHGYIYEVAPYARRARGPIRSAGRFAHESVAFSPLDGWLYMTEDNFGFPSGFYRYRPPVSPLRCRSDARRRPPADAQGRRRATRRALAGPAENARYRVTWVDIDEPDPTFPEGTTNNEAIQAVGLRASPRAPPSSRASRAWSTTGASSTSPRPRGPARPRGPLGLRLRRRSRAGVGVRHPPRDAAAGVRVALARGARPARQRHREPAGHARALRGRQRANFLRGLTKHGRIFDFALNSIPGQESDEFAGSTFAPGGGTLYVNIQSRNAMSFAIWGPWWRGGF
jgi:hypothetical protein